MVGNSITQVHNVLRNYSSIFTKKRDAEPTNAPVRQLHDVDRVSISPEALEKLKATKQSATSNDTGHGQSGSKPNGPDLIKIDLSLLYLL